MWWDIDDDDIPAAGSSWGIIHVIISRFVEDR